MTQTDPDRTRFWLYVRLSLGAGLLGVAFGYYLQSMGRTEMDGFGIFSYAVRGIIVGAFFWYFEIFWVRAPKGDRLRQMAYGPRLIIKIIAYVVAIEAGLLVGYVIFYPREALSVITGGG